MLTAALRGLKLSFAIALAVVLSAQLVLHQHSLIPEESATPSFPCTVCAFGADPASSIQPSLTFEPVVAWTLAAAPEPAFTCGTSLLLPSRAPPSAG